jgi:hypothetical protein
MPTPLLEALKDNREAVVKYLTECRVCSRNNGDPEDRDRLRAANPFCLLTPCPFRGNAC